MKGTTLLGIVVLGALLVIFSGVSQAGGWMNQSSGDQKPAGQAMGQGNSETAPDFWTYEYWQASEAGTLASFDRSEASSSIDVPPIRWAEQDPIVLEVGPFKYREVDLGE